MDTFALGPKWGSRGAKRFILGAILGAEWSCFEAVAAAILEKRSGCFSFAGETSRWFRLRGVESSRVESSGVE